MFTCTVRSIPGSSKVMLRDISRLNVYDLCVACNYLMALGRWINIYAPCDWSVSSMVQKSQHRQCFDPDVALPFIVRSRCITVNRPQWGVFCVTSIGNSIVEIGRSQDRLISSMVFPILVNSIFKLLWRSDLIWFIPVAEKSHGQW